MAWLGNIITVKFCEGRLTIYFLHKAKKDQNWHALKLNDFINK